MVVTILFPVRVVVNVPFEQVATAPNWRNPFVPDCVWLTGQVITNVCPLAVDGTGGVKVPTNVVALDGVRVS